MVASIAIPASASPHCIFRKFSQLCFFSRGYSLTTGICYLFSVGETILVAGSATMNALDPIPSDAQARLAEIGEILSRGLVRLRARQSSQISKDHGEISVDFSVDQRGHVAPNPNVGAAE